MRIKPVDLPDLVRAFGYLLGRLAFCLWALSVLTLLPNPALHTHILVWLRRLAQ
jgi:hypothetical protein